MGTVVTIGADQTLTVTIAGSTTNITGVRYFSHYPPKVGSQVWLDTDGRDWVAVGAIAGLGGQVPSCRLYRNTAYSISSGATYTTVAWDASVFDPWGMWPGGTSANIVAPITGTYLVSYNYGYNANATGQRSGYVTSSSGSQNIYSNVEAPPAGSIANVHASGVMQLTKGDVVQLTTRQTSGSLLAMYTGNPYSTAITVTYLGA
jgi:hypothetical protein